MGHGKGNQDPPRIAAWIRWLGGLIAANRASWVKLGNLESRFLDDRLAAVSVERPIYVNGLARAGTTIVLEFLARHREVVTHRYKDYPPVFTPYWWNRLLETIGECEAQSMERVHADRILVTPDSPEAMEEVLWMAFFPTLHDPKSSNVLTAAIEHPGFERFYRDHVRKLLLARHGSRFASKGNYNVTRLEYILKLFPDARLIIPVRAPAAHIASLMKQHELFCRLHTRDPDTLEHMRRTGHFEFGLDRRPINVGDTAAATEIQTLWRQGEEVRGWARYWNQIYGYLADLLAANKAVKAAALVLRYEALCSDPTDSLRSLLDHCRLDNADGVVESFAPGLAFPTYYQPSFTETELGVIAAETAETARRFGYEPRSAPVTAPA